MIVRKITIVILVIINLALSSCVNRINHSNNFIIDPQQKAAINKLGIWEWRGKLSWHDQRNNQAAMCYIKWVKKYSKSYITLNSAMNIKTVYLQIDNGKIINNSNILSQDIDNIIKNISLNIDNLNYWLLGAPNPKYKYTLINEGFEQQNWEIKYLHYKTYKKFLLPSHIIIKNNCIDIKIIINDFN